MTSKTLLESSCPADVPSDCGGIQRPNTTFGQPHLVDDSEEGGVRSAPTDSLAAYVHALRRRWIAVLSLGLICGGGAAATAWITDKDQYTATVQFQVAATPESVAFDDLRAGSARRL